MQPERLSDPTYPMYMRTLTLYKASFPPHEQRQRISQDAVLRDGNYHFQLIYDRESFVGLMLYWETEKFIYVEHFCILPELQGRQYGQRALALLSQRNKPVILEIDPPVDSASQRRKAFYERCGFAENPYYVHPPYRRGNRGHELVVMSWLGLIAQPLYDSFARYLQQRVMHRAYT